LGERENEETEVKNNNSALKEGEVAISITPRISRRDELLKDPHVMICARSFIQEVALILFKNDTQLHAPLQKMSSTNI
jgi:hypothetical protein